MTVQTELSDVEAEALAQFLKRVAFYSVRAHARTDDEAYVMIDALGKVRAALAEEGYRPR